MHVEYAAPLRISVPAEHKFSAGAPSIGTISGYATRYYTPHVYRAGVDMFDEDCFSDGLRSGDPVHFLLNHDPAYPVTSTSEGRLSLQSTEVALMFRVDIPDTPNGRFAMEMIRMGGGQAGMSVGYTVSRSTTRKIGGQQMRLLQKCRLNEISIVRVGAVPGAFAVSDQVRGDTKSRSEAAYQKLAWSLVDLTTTIAQQMEAGRPRV